MNILDLFSGVGGFAKAFEDVFGTDHQHYYSDVDKYALAVYKYQFPNAIALGDVTQIDVSKLPPIDFMFAGFPCTDLAICKANREGLDGARSGLFYNTVEIWKRTKPKYWIFENVASMAKSEKDKISAILGVEPYLINSALVSAQQRRRYFWTNIPNITQPEDRKIYLKDILETGDSDRLKSYCLDASYYKGTNLEQYLAKSRRQIVFDKANKLGHINDTNSQGNRIYSENDKSITLSANSGGIFPKTGGYLINQPVTFSLSNSRQDISITANNKSNCLTSSFRGSPDGNGRPGVIIPVALRNIGEGKKPEYNKTDKANSLTTVQTDSMVEENYIIRKLTPIETNRLQTFEDNWNEFGTFETKKGLEVKDISNSQRYKQCGNAVTVEVIKHILKHVII
jgi:DNA-cytosine methyltransferase